MGYKFTIPTLSDSQTEKAINELQKIQDVLNDLALTLKHVHWNVTGPAFIGVHEMLDGEIDEVRDGVDAIAERISALGGVPNGLSEQILSTAKTVLPKFPLVKNADTNTYLKETDAQYTVVETLLRDGIEKLNDADYISSNIVQDILLGREQFQWKMRSHLV